MYNNTELKILEQIYLKPGIHKRELSKQLKLGMPSIDYALKKIEKIIKKEKSGNQIKYFLDYSKSMLTPFLCMVEYSRFERLPVKINLLLKEFFNELKDKPVIAIIFGSYAKGNYVKNSDIDIFLVFNKVDNGNKIENTAKKVGMRFNTKLSPVYIDYESFRESFYNSSKKFYKNLKENKIIIIGFEWWRYLKDEEA